MKHDSRYGTTCWICGHPGRRTKRLGEIICQCCDDCKLVEGTREEIREMRNLDVLGLKLVLRGGEYKPVYWTMARLEEMFRNYEGLPLEAVDGLRWIEYSDPTWEGTKARMIKSSKEYQKEFYKKIRDQRKKEQEHGK